MMQGVDISGVRILPAIIHFQDTSSKNVYRTEICVKNISKTSKSIRYYKPQLPNFKLKVRNSELSVAPGLEVPAVLEYNCESDESYQDRVIITVNGEPIELPVTTEPCRPDLSLDGPVDFGNIVANSKVISQTISLTNKGAKAGDFKITYNGKMPINILPSSGVVPPHSEMMLKIEFVSKAAGSFSEKALVQLKGRENSVLQIKGNVVQGALELLDYNTLNLLPCVSFNPTYYGTDRTQTAILFNNGPEPTCYVAVLNEDAIGQEVGVDLTKSTAATLNARKEASINETENELTKLITVIPNQGVLAPYEKVPIFFRFSPRRPADKKGFRHEKKAAPRQDFAVFVLLKVIGASDGFDQRDLLLKAASQSPALEVAVTATALPVLISLSPAESMEFGSCAVGERVDALCTLRNDSQHLPVSYQLRKCAHFSAAPNSGKISPGQTQDIIFSFAPHQVGSFKPKQYLDVLGTVVEDEVLQKVIYSVAFQLRGMAEAIATEKQPVYNPGITPKITNEVGLFVKTTFANAKNHPRNALINSQGTKLHRIARSAASNDAGSLIAFPNDRARSVRPDCHSGDHKTIFTREPRHTFVDPDYAYSDDEFKAVKEHQQQYLDYLRAESAKRISTQRAKEYVENENDVNMGMKPAAGLGQKKIKFKELEVADNVQENTDESFLMLSTKKLADMEKDTAKKVKDGLNAVPSTPAEKSDCSKILSPQELHKIVIGPPTVDFEQVCLKSTSQRDIHIVNNLNKHIHVVMKVDCRELRQTSPLSQVVPPMTKASVPLIFESKKEGRFQRSFDYEINGFYKNHITVFAVVVPVALRLDTNYLKLSPAIGQPSEAGIRGVVKLTNVLNYPAEFTWSPILGEKGTAFSIRPATGTVGAESDLDCEVVFHPSFIAPETGEFQLQVHGGNSLKLDCIADLGQSNASFSERRVLFGLVPLHLTTTRTALLKNAGPYHAYFQVLDPSPFNGLIVSPVHGVVPAGGTAELKIHLTPNGVLKFDTRVEVAIRGGRHLDLRLGGSVEEPKVDIDMNTFNLGGVYVGSSLTTPFKLTNKANTRARVEFDMSRYRDFDLDFTDKQTAEDRSFQAMNPGFYSLTLDAWQTIDASLIFNPTEVASYDFVLPVTINQTNAPTPMATPLPSTPAPSLRPSADHIIQPRPVHVEIATPKKKVVATALRQPMKISQNNIDFSLSPRFYEQSQAAGTGHSKTTEFHNKSDHEVHWYIDMGNLRHVKSNTNLLDSEKEGVFKFLHASGVPFLDTNEKTGVNGTLAPGQRQEICVVFDPRQPGEYSAKVPVFLTDDSEHPYQHLQLSGTLKAPSVWFDPQALVLTPVPLDTEVAVEFSLLAANYTEMAEISVTSPVVECDDGSTSSPLTVTFTRGQMIEPCCGDEGQKEPCSLTCKVSFSSSRPVSFCQPLQFVDSIGNTYYLNVTATADNCLLTCYPFLALHRSDHQIVCEQGHALRGRKTVSKESLNVGEAILVPMETPLRPGSRPSTTATSSNFETSSTSYEESSLTETSSTGRDGALNNAQSSSVIPRQREDVHSRSLGSALFPEEDSEEGIFHMEVLMAAQRWFSHHGWSGGPHPVTVPDSLRAGISKKPPEEKAVTPKGTTVDSSGGRRENKTVYDMIMNLCGRQVPGIPINNPLPKQGDERAKQVYWQHTTLLTFLKTQGACLSSVKPEYLMQPSEYRQWVRLQKKLENKKSKNRTTLGSKTLEEEAIEDELFEAVSKRAWTDVLLQLLKTLVLPKISPRQFKNTPLPGKGGGVWPAVDPDPLCSNVYSISERIVLLWLNHNYEQYRRKIWPVNVPASRWIVNFDFDLLDGLVLGAVLGAHAPYLVQSHLSSMYTQPATAEQCLHNALKVVNAMRSLGLDYDIQAIDITDPNPVALMLLCVHLYLNLPQFLPKSGIDFVGALHTKVVRQVRLSNPSGKPLVYQAFLVGQDARDFTIPKGLYISIPSKSNFNVGVEFVSRFLRVAEATLVLVGRRQGSSVGCTLVFSLRGVIDKITSVTSEKFSSPIYQQYKVKLKLVSPFKKAGDFDISIIESEENPKEGEQELTARSRLQKVKHKKSTGAVKSSAKSRRQTMYGLPGQGPFDEEEEGEIILRAFSCPLKKVELDSLGTGEVELSFLPFNIGKRNCSIVFSNDDLGQFLCSVEAVATDPLPLELPYKRSPRSVRVSSAAAAGSGRGLYGGARNVVYWKVESGRKVIERLKIPIANVSKERALIQAAKQEMDDAELERRHVTGTLGSGTITAKVIEKLSTKSSVATKRMHRKGRVGRNFRVSSNSKLFKFPGILFIPDPEHNLDADEGEEKYVSMPVTFEASEVGLYTCKITLRCDDDVRIYMIECTVIPEGNEAIIEFTTPVHRAVTQNIPVVNPTYNNWRLVGQISGRGFTGPNSLCVPANRSANYPLTFRPSQHGDVEGKLVLLNCDDVVQCMYKLKGIAENALPLEHIELACEAKQVVRRNLVVPNATNKKIYYRVESDLECISGPESVTVLPGQVGQYDLTYSPLKRGESKGIIAFSASSNPVKELDSDGDEVEPFEADPDQDGYRVWYQVSLKARPPPPLDTLKISCHCQKKAVLEVPVTNPIDEDLNFDVEVNGVGLNGADKMFLPAGGSAKYKLLYAPALIGEFSGSLIMYNETVGEFWFALSLEAVTPEPTQLPHMECELGRWVRQTITLNNPTNEALELIPKVSNLNNFALERDTDRPLHMRPQSTLNLALTFMPSTLGTEDHNARISFLCEQLGEWVFLASGTGLLPRPQDPVSVTAQAGSSSSLIIPFRNPLDVPAKADVVLIDSKTGAEIERTTPFCLLLKCKRDVYLGPKSALDIPLSFAPENMKMFEVIVGVHLQRADGQHWNFDTRQQAERAHLAPGDSEGLREIRWQFLVRGFPELDASEHALPAMVVCQSRQVCTDRLEVLLSGVAPSVSGPHRVVRVRAVTPADQKQQDDLDGVVVTDHIAVSKEFTHELYFTDEDAKRDLRDIVRLDLVRKERGASGVVTLTFNIDFRPLKPMSHQAELLVQGSTGGLWRFPVRFISMEPEVDDCIIVEAAGLNKVSTAGFRMNSHNRYPIAYRAYLVNGSDVEFSVTPAAGELPAVGQEGVMINVHFKPQKYGKVYQGKLVIQTADMQWTYALRGVLPDYIAPRGASSRPMAGPHPDPRIRVDKKNYVRENLKVNVTGISSPIKGGKIIQKE